MEYIEGVMFVFRNDEFEPIHERIVHAFVCAEAGDADAAVGESPLFGGEQVEGRREDADLISSR